MAMTLHAGISIRLPEDEFDAADMMVKIRPLWRTLTDALKEAGIKHDQELKTSATKRPGAASGTTSNGTRRTRRVLTPTTAPLDTTDG
jgi:hypothetical protein